jgi:hypothetical protein
VPLGSGATELLYAAAAGGVQSYLSAPTTKQYVTVAGLNNRTAFDLLLAAAGTVGQRYVPAGSRAGVRMAAAYGVGDFIKAMVDNYRNKQSSGGGSTTTGAPVLDYSILSRGNAGGGTGAGDTLDAFATSL